MVHATQWLLAWPAIMTHVKSQEFLNQSGIFPGDRFSLAVFQHLRTEDGVVFREGIVSLDLKMGLAVPRNGCGRRWPPQRRNKGVTDASEHGVIRPYGEVISAAFFQTAGIMVQVSLSVGLR